MKFPLDQQPYLSHSTTEPPWGPAKWYASRGKSLVYTTLAVAMSLLASCTLQRFGRAPLQSNNHHTRPRDLETYQAGSRDPTPTIDQHVLLWCISHRVATMPCVLTPHPPSHQVAQPVAQVTQGSAQDPAIHKGCTGLDCKEGNCRLCILSRPLDRLAEKYIS